MSRLFCMIILLLLPVSASQAQILSIDKVPDLLKPWINWVLMDEHQYQCPFFYNNFQQKRCSWPGLLTLDLSEKEGRFSSHWTLYQYEWITLPGNENYWPQSVTVNNNPALVMNRRGKPAVYLSKGDYQIKGQFIWDRIPDNLEIPEYTGLFNLKVTGKSIHYPAIKKGVVWLKANDNGHKKPENVQNRLDLQVFRKVIDDVPLQLMTFLELEVSGEQREIKLPYALLEGFIPIQLKSPLPARVEQDGSLLVQIRPGRWHIELNAHYPEQLESINFDVSNKNWPPTEIWVFQAMPYQRVVEIEGLTAIDPSQTNLPSQWRLSPAYQMKQGDRMIFKVVRRGDPGPEPNQLSLSRKLWLDFDGSGYTVEDQISGKMTRGWRLNALPETRLGQVKINGQNQLVTQLAGVRQQGVEVRKGLLQLTADSRITGAIDVISATGWQQQFQHLKAELNIPPGWRLLAVSGVDNDPDSWISRWTLLDLFLVLIAALAISRLWNIYWGLFALFTLTLIWHEADAPRFIWLNILAAIAMIRVLPEGRFLQFVKWYRNACWLGLLIMVIPFMVTQIRVGLYPQLQKQWHPVSPASYSTTDAVQQMARAKEDIESAPAKELRMRKLYSKASDYAGKSVNFDRIDPDANIQTGPGLPQWQWHKTLLSWNGRVDSQQQLELWYLSPRVAMWLNFLQVILVTVLSLLMFGVLDKKLKISMPLLTMILIMPLLSAPVENTYANAGFPDQKILDDLKNHLLQAPECLPACAQIEQMNLVINEKSMEIQLQIHVQQQSAVPLPARFKQWYPNKVTIDGKDAQALIRTKKGLLWLSLSQGIHNVVMQGLNSRQHKFTLPLPLKPHHIVTDAEGWRVEGLHENGTVDKQLHFTRLRIQQKTTETMRPVALPPFIRIERTLKLGLDWRIVTRIIRVQPGDSAVVLEYPLLQGEAVTTANIRVKNKRVLINMSAGQQVMQWQSLLENREKIDLQAAQTDRWTEVWRLDASPTWHLQMSGIAVVHHQDRQGRWLPEWRPWPGESISLFITRPEAVKGATLTIDKSELQIKPGKRSQEAELTVTIRSSKGRQHTITLPKQAVLQSVLINGVTQPIRQKQNTVMVPLRPGKQTISLNWNENKLQSSLLTTPHVNLGIPSVNNYIKVLSGNDRWILFTWGPEFGPAALIWGVLIVIALLSLGLGEIKLTPLKHWQWFLLLLGLSQIPVTAALLVVIWLMALAIRGKQPLESTSYFNIMQLALGMLTLTALTLLFVAVQQGLLGSPDMQIAGNQSTAFNLNWYQDRNSAWLPTATVISLPLKVYRILMLLWSLWLAVSLLNWLKWGWQCFSQDGLWKKRETSKKS